MSWFRKRPLTMNDVISYDQYDGERLTRQQVEERSEHYGDYFLLPAVLVVPRPYVGEPSEPRRYRVEIYNSLFPHRGFWFITRVTGKTFEGALAGARQAVNDIEARFESPRRGAGSC